MVVTDPHGEPCCCCCCSSFNLVPRKRKRRSGGVQEAMEIGIQGEEDPSIQETVN